MLAMMSAYSNGKAVGENSMLNMFSFFAIKLPICYCFFHPHQFEFANTNWPTYYRCNSFTRKTSIRKLTTGHNKLTETSITFLSCFFFKLEDFSFCDEGETFFVLLFSLFHRLQWRVFTGFHRFSLICSASSWCFGNSISVIGHTMLRPNQL